MTFVLRRLALCLVSLSLGTAWGQSGTVNAICAAGSVVYVGGAFTNKRAALLVTLPTTFPTTTS